MYRTASLLLLVPVALAAPARGVESVDFNRDIRPILSNACYKCHGPGTQKGGLRLDSSEAAWKKAIVRHKPANSPLIARITATDAERMPPPEAAEPLTAEQVAKLTKWIEQGANYADHWAFTKVAAPAIPEVKSRDWTRNSIDNFVLARLEAVGLRPSPAADRSTLVRRLYLDLVGLLPEPKELAAFIDDQSPDAYEKLVDRLLASPHYGERQARHWLDLARYADSNGFTIDGQRSIWPYRDWVIKAFNDDMPFDRFTQEQLAGDLLPKATNEQLVATGFHRNTPVNEEGGTDPEQFRVERTVDRTNTTGAVWLGLTMGCAQCHDHKYDPLSQKDYYRLYAFFNATSEPALKMATPEQEKQLAALNATLEAAKKEKKPAADIQKITREIRDFEQKNVKSSLIVRDQARPTHVHLRGDFLQKGEEVKAGTPAALPTLSAGTATRLDLAKWLTSPDNPLTSRVLVNRIWQQYFGKGLVVTENDFGMQGRLPTHPELLDHLATDLVKGGWAMKRIHKQIVMSATYRQSSTLRRDLTENDPYNTLLGRQNRVRIEAEIIRDAALSASGLLNRKMGGPGVYPPQPKEVFAFTQSNKPWPESTGPDRYRRGMYTFIWRQSQHPLLTTFDGADAQTTCTRRNRSNTPLQALHLANDAVFVEFATALGKRILAEGPDDTMGRIDYAYQLCFCRPPSTAESKRVEAYLNRLSSEPAEKQWMMVGRVLMNLDEFVTRE